MKYSLVRFDTSGITNDCPKSDCGGATSAECKDCPSFGFFEGFNVICKYGTEPDLKEKWIFVRDFQLLKNVPVPFHIGFYKWHIELDFRSLYIRFGWEKSLQAFLEIDEELEKEWGKERTESLKKYVNKFY